MILVVDDHANTRRVMQLLLARHGFETAGAASGFEALKFLESHVPHCIILDNHMPEMSGIDVLKWIRTNPRYQDVYVIMFTAAEWGVREAAIAAGANEFIRKDSLDWAKLLPVLNRRCHATLNPLIPDVAKKEERDTG